MEKSPCSLFLALSAVLFLALALPLFSLEAEPDNQQENPLNSNSALNRLTEISNQLSALNERLHSELLNSRQNSRELQNMLELSKQELEGLRQELETLQTASTELLSRAENSQTESTALLTALKKAESSLVSLEQSFSAYRLSAEQKILSLERENKVWKLACIAAGILAAGFGVMLVTGR